MNEYLNRLNKISRSKLALLALFLAVVICLTVGLIALNNHKSAVKKNSNPTYVKYSGGLKPFFLLSPKPDEGASFLMPEDFFSYQTSYSTSADTSVQTKYSKLDNQRFINSQIIAIKTTNPDLSISDIEDNLADPSSPAFQKMLEPVTSLTGKNYSWNFSKPQNFTGTNITSNAWRLDFTMSPKITPNLGNYIGRVVIAAGSTQNYYLAVESLQKNWAQNQNVWQKVLTSFAIDQ